MELDEVRFHAVEMGDVPMAYAGVPVEIENDEGKYYSARMVAGLVGTETIAGPGATGGQMTGLKPASGWFMYKTKEQRKRICRNPEEVKKRKEPTVVEKESGKGHGQVEQTVKKIKSCEMVR